MNNNYKENLLKLKNYLILASMIGGITLLPGCGGQKQDEQNNKQTVNIENDSNLNNESTVLLVLDNGNYIIYDCDDCTDDSAKYTITINGEIISIPNSNVVRSFYTDEYGNAHKKAKQYVYKMLHIDSDGFGSNRIIDYDDQVQSFY